MCVYTQIAALAIASANGLVLKGGSEAVNTNNALMSIVSEALLTHGAQNAVQMVYVISYYGKKGKAKFYTTIF